ncbi:hypothetical protein I352_03283 [Cryptococcus deuterogattii MMRL2647]|nr:hypothetical protein I352_03283 [Cryptococcus deuterogattii MMRL2647]
MLRTLNSSRRILIQLHYRGIQTHAARDTTAKLSPPSMMGQMARRERGEGNISSVFASLSGEGEKPLPPRFAELKRTIIGDEANQRRLVAGWGRLTKRLAEAAQEIEEKQQDIIPQTTYNEFINGGSEELTTRIKNCGAVIIREVVDQQTALKWLEDAKAYIAKNPSVKGFPENDKQVFELYWSKTQLSARSHPRSMATQRALLSLFSHSPDAPVSLHTPLTYADRFRIRNPGDAQFALGPHADGGSVERWEDETYRRVYQKCLEGKWEEYDAWTIGERALAKQSMYEGPGACGIFRAFQGWTSMSDTGPTEGTLKVYPLIKELTAYTMMRPLFRLEQNFLERSIFQTPTGSLILRLHVSQTRLSLGTKNMMTKLILISNWTGLWSAFQGLSLGTRHGGTEANMIHAVESIHQGKGPSAVLYIPAVPLTPHNVEYIRDQKRLFMQGRPGPDFPGGVGESQFIDRGKIEDIESTEGKQALPPGNATYGNRQTKY